MRAQTITTMTRRRRKARRHRAFALALGVCALTIPASAGGAPIEGGYSVNTTMTHENPHSIPGFGTAITRSETNKAEPSGLVGYPTPTPAGERAAERVVSSYGIPVPSGVEPTLIAGSPASADDGFDWASAAVGAGAAMALAALGATALLTVRRRTTVSPSPSAS